MKCRRSGYVFRNDRWEYLDNLIDLVSGTFAEGPSTYIDWGNQFNVQRASETSSAREADSESEDEEDRPSQGRYNSDYSIHTEDSDSGDSNGQERGAE